MGTRPKRAARSLSYFRHGKDAFAVLSMPAMPRLPASLTKAEREIAAQLYAGKTNAQIARARGVAMRTVANQVASIIKKVGVGSRMALVAFLADTGD